MDRSYEQFLNDGKRTIEQLESFGINVPSASRFRQYIRYLDRICHAPAGSQASDAILHAWFQACLELDELRVTTNSLSSPDQLPAWLPVVQTIVSGPAMPRGDRHSAARDIQFELLLGALFRGAGLAVALAEPDLLVQFRDRSLAIAAKRLRSPNKLGRRLRDAEKQLARARMRGLIAIDVTQVITPDSGYVRAPSVAFALASTREGRDRFTAQYRDLIQHETQPRYAFGVLLHYTVFVLDESRTQLCILRPADVIALTTTSKADDVLLRELTEVIQSAWS